MFLCSEYVCVNKDKDRSGKCVLSRKRCNERMCGFVSCTNCRNDDCINSYGVFEEQPNICDGVDLIIEEDEEREIFPFSVVEDIEKKTEEKKEEQKTDTTTTIATADALFLEKVDKNNPPKKYYAIKNGRKKGIVLSWSSCKTLVDGYAGAVFKSFVDANDAVSFVSEGTEKIADNIPYAFVDGSYNENTKTYGYGGFLVADGRKYVLQGHGNDSDMANMRNVAGEISGAIGAIKKARELGLKEIAIYYDYSGIEMWATKKWKANKKGTIEYQMFASTCGIKLHFVKVKGHSGIEGNEEADRLAKEAVGITE